MSGCWIVAPLSLPLCWCCNNQRGENILLYAITGKQADGQYYPGTQSKREARNKKWKYPNGGTLYVIKE